MNQKKIGSFIAARRKDEGMTQSQLAEKLGITDKAVSKWETGKSMPDLSLFKPLCELLEITLNELLAGEFISDENLKEKSDKILFEIVANWLGKEQWEAKKEPGASIVLKLENVKKTYRNGDCSTAAVKDISFEVEKGSFTGIMGASGSGKTTLLNMIATIDKASGGRIEINGQDIALLSEKELASFRREHLGFVFQEYNLLDTLTVYENIALALIIKQTPKETVQQTILDLAQKLGISGILNQFPYEISGGQRQRCACARAIATRPDLILADEPTGSVKLVQHYPKIIPVTFPALSTFISSMADRQRVRFSSRVKVSYIALKSAVKYFLTAAKSGGASCAGSGSCPSAAVYIS